ncbi:hypothetical protein TNCV_1487631 [Trichonephila clavipes]|nr:hypothetical protein TNCV_1487631 [Trichonephila clavipes]
MEPAFRRCLQLFDFFKLFFEQQVLSDCRMQKRSRYLRKLAVQLCNSEATVLHHVLPLKVNKINIDEGRSPTAFFIMDILMTLKTAYTSDVPSAYS